MAQRLGLDLGAPVMSDMQADLVVDDERFNLNVLVDLKGD
jgi:hypothetical protein